ncbi:MAG: response regulator transcription factor [Bacteroidota bacterium]
MSTPASIRPASILIVEDDPDIAELLKIHLGDLGYAVTHRADGNAGLAAARTGRHALVLLDLMLPGLDGMEVCKRIRQTDPHLPILMLTAKSEELDKVLGLELGADDYLTKPFSVRELLARVKALFRRIDVDQRAAEAEEATPTRLRYGALAIDPVKRRATLDEEPLDLTAKEWELLLLFGQDPGRVYSRQELLDLVWGYQYDGYSHTVNSHINRLRGKIEADPSNPQFIRTLRGLGYRFADAAEVTSE